MVDNTYTGPNYGQCLHNRGKDQKEAPLHGCPFVSDVHNDPDPEYCNCCDDCETQCAMDI